MTDNSKIPPGVEKYAESPLFTEVSVPAKLTSRHNTKAGTWGRICVLSGSLKYIVTDGEHDTQILTTSQAGVIVPEQYHRVEIMGPVEFKIEFFH